MNKHNILTTLTTILCMLSIALSASAANASTPHLLFRDTFAGSTLNTSHWSTCYEFPTKSGKFSQSCVAAWNGEQERYAASQVTVANNTLSLTAIPQVISMHGFTSQYLSGMIDSAGKFSFKYGYVSALVHIPSGQGFWPAMWMLAENGQAVTELDVMEAVDTKTTQDHQGVHYILNGKHKHSGGPATVSDLSNGYHNLAVDWEPNRITWYVDGVATRVETNYSHIPHTSMYLIFNLAVGGFWPGSPNASTPFPSSMDIQDVQVWSAKPA